MGSNNPALQRSNNPVFIVVVINDFPQRLQAAVVHVRRGAGEVAQRRRFEGAAIFFVIF